MSFNWPTHTKEEIAAVVKVLKSGKVNYFTGDQNHLFEKEFAFFSHTKYAVSLANGTVAIEAALRSLEVGKGDEVIVTSRTYVASASSIVNVGAIPVFADVDNDSQNISTETIETLITSKTKAIICVHLAGWPCDMDAIIKLAKKNKLFVIEDCAQAHGAKYKGKSVGSFGDVGCWSFCNDKIMSTGGEGGMITTNNKKYWSKIWSLKDHGKNWNAVYKKNLSNRYKWLHHTFGTNFRMTEMQAALGRIQLKKINIWNKRRRKNMNTILDVAKDLPILRVPKLICDCNNEKYKRDCCVHGAYKTYVFVRGGSNLRNLIINRINSEGIPCFSGSCPEVYLEKSFQSLGYYPKKRHKIAKKLGETSLMFLCHPTLTNKEILKTCEVLRKVCLKNI